MQKTTASKKHLFLVRATRYVQYLVLPKMSFCQKLCLFRNFYLYENMYNEHHLYNKHIYLKNIFIFIVFYKCLWRNKSVLCKDTIFKIVLSNVHIS